MKRACFRGAELPNTLCVHLKRFEFDYETMQRLKIKSRFEFPMELDMTPFTVEALERDASRDDDGSAPDEHPLEPTPYRLVGVVVHSGTAFAGHYYSYIRERARPPGAPAEGGDSDLGSRWHVYDDTRVEPYDVASLEADTFGGKYTVNLSALQGASGDAASPKEFDRPNSAYMLFYERAASGAEDDSGGVGIASAPPSRVNTPALVARPVPTPPSAETVAPPAMPRRVRGAVMTQNLQFVFDANLFNREYFDFTRRLVESTATTTAANPSRKAQRREETRGPGAMRGVENGDDGHPRRDPEEAEERAVLGIRVATEFLCRVYLRAHRSMRDAESLASWRVAVVSLLGRHASARRWFLEFLRDRPAHLAAFLTRCPSAEARETFAYLVAAALKFAVSLDEGAPPQTPSSPPRARRWGSNTTPRRRRRQRRRRVANPEEPRDWWTVCCKISCRRSTTRRRVPSASRRRRIVSTSSRSTRLWAPRSVSSYFGTMSWVGSWSSRARRITRPRAAPTRRVPRREARTGCYPRWCEAATCRNRVGSSRRRARNARRRTRAAPWSGASVIFRRTPRRTDRPRRRRRPRPSRSTGGSSPCRRRRARNCTSRCSRRCWWMSPSSRRR